MAKDKGLCQKLRKSFAQMGIGREVVLIAKKID